MVLEDADEAAAVDREAVPRVDGDELGGRRNHLDRDGRPVDRAGDPGDESADGGARVADTQPNPRLDARAGRLAVDAGDEVAAAAAVEGGSDHPGDVDAE